MFLNKFYVKCFLLIVMNIFCEGHGQRGFIRGFEQNFCRTPLDDMGTCVSLKYCPEVLTLFSRLPQNSAKQYSMSLQRICGNRITPDQYPVVCCTVVKPVNDNLPPPTTTTTSSSTTTTSTSTSTTVGPLDDANENRSSQSQESSCFTKNFDTGTCKPLQDCPILFNQINNDRDNEQLKSDLRLAHSKCGGVKTLVCCPPKSTTTISLNNNSIHTLPSEEDGCGQTSVLLPKIVGGEESVLGAWPWMALIGYDIYSTRPFRCGGTLISARHVLTAAHCIRFDLSFVRLGEFNLSTQAETQHVDIDVIKHVKHPLYGKNRRSDIAVLLLERNVQFTEYISPICMPNSETLRTKSYIDGMAYVAGWGNTMQGGSPSQVLKQVQLPIQENDVCRQIYASRGINANAEEFDDSIFCVGFTIGGSDSCQGDSGGPLMIPEYYKGTVRYYLIGVISYGLGCGKVPGIYINTQKKMDWVLEQIRDM